MKKFKDFIFNEEVDLTAGVESGKMDVHDHAVRNNINAFLNGELACNVVTPYVAMNKVNKVLANFGIILPKAPYMEDEQGVHVFNIKQFGKVAGMRNDGSVVTKMEEPYHLYFEWKRNERGMYDVFCEIVDDDELDTLLDSASDDVADDREEKLDEEEHKKPALKNVYLDAYVKKKKKEKEKEKKIEEDTIGDMIKATSNPKTPKQDIKKFGATEGEPATQKVPATDTGKKLKEALAEAASVLKKKV